MTDNFQLIGSAVSTPTDSLLSGSPMLVAQLNEAMSLVLKTEEEYQLTADASQAVGFGGLASASTVLIKAVGGPITVSVTSAAGSTQIIPVDSFFFLMSFTTVVTALSLTRTPGVFTTVKVFLGQHS